jgi:hypothetical protein
MKDHRARTWAVLASLMVFVLAACGAPAAAPTEALPPAPMPTEVSLGRISGRIEYQAPPAPASALYVVSVLDPGLWFVYDLAASDPMLFDVEVPAGMYQLYARQSDGGPMAAAYLNPDETLGAVNVGPGQVIPDILLKFAAPQNLCQRTALPVSPDGRFAAIDAGTCPPLDAPGVDSIDETLATLRGTITYQAPPTPTSILYFVSADHWYWLEVPGGDPVASFEWQVAPGTYQLFAFQIGSEGGSAAGFYRPSAYGDKTAGPLTVTVTAGQIVENIAVQNINSDNCVFFPIPASPDGRFPALEAETCTP